MFEKINRVSRKYANNHPCVYIGVSQDGTFGIEHPHKIQVKIGMSRHMGERRRTLKSKENICTIIEYPIPTQLDTYLRAIEKDSHAWLHCTPTAIYWTEERILIDNIRAELIVKDFPKMVNALIIKYLQGAE
jgi:hypothetical protein